MASTATGGGILIVRDNSNVSAFEATASTGTIKLGKYGTGGISGSVAYHLAVDSSGNVIEEKFNKIMNK